MDSVNHLLNNWGQIYKVYHAQTMRQLDYTYVVFFTQDWFHYFLVYDPQQKTLVADRGEMGIGTAYQAHVPKTAMKGNFYCCILRGLPFINR